MVKVKDCREYFLFALYLISATYSVSSFQLQTSVVRSHNPVKLSHKHLKNGGKVFSSSIDTENFPLSSASEFIETLNTMKKDGKVSRWNSSLMEVKSTTTKADLQFISRNSFASLNYFEDIIAGARNSQQQGSAEMPFIAVSAASFLLSAIVIPLLPIPDWSKNVFGLIFLLTPFLLIITNLAAPGIYQNYLKKNSKEKTVGLNERILYHEAGHFIAGYLCGVPVISYDITGDRDAGTTIALDISETATVSENIQALKEKSGNLLVVSMAGMVAETLRFGDSKGGAEDLLFATEILRIMRVPVEEKEGALRWAVLKALLLLRINRDALDRVADNMRAGAPVVTCINTIEEEPL